MIKLYVFRKFYFKLYNSYYYSNTVFHGAIRSTGLYGSGLKYLKNRSTGYTSIRLYFNFLKITIKIYFNFSVFIKFIFFYFKMLLCFLKFGYPVSVENTKKIFLKPPDSSMKYGK